MNQELGGRTRWSIGEVQTSNHPGSNPVYQLVAFASTTRFFHSLKMRRSWPLIVRPSSFAKVTISSYTSRGTKIDFHFDVSIVRPHLCQK